MATEESARVASAHLSQAGVRAVFELRFASPMQRSTATEESVDVVSVELNQAGVPSGAEVEHSRRHQALLRCHYQNRSQANTRKSSWGALRSFPPAEDQTTLQDCVAADAAREDTLRGDRLL